LRDSKPLRDDDHIRRRFADLESFLEQWRIEGGLQIESKERFGERLAHFIKEVIEDLPELGTNSLAEFLL
jgi:hypothetical protein